jgi:hypothetical protein
MAIWVIKYVCVRAPLKTLLGRPYRFVRSSGVPDGAVRLFSRDRGTSPEPGQDRREEPG